MQLIVFNFYKLNVPLKRTQLVNKNKIENTIFVHRENSVVFHFFIYNQLKPGAATRKKSKYVSNADTDVLKQLHTMIHSCILQGSWKIYQITNTIISFVEQVSVQTALGYYIFRS